MKKLFLRILLPLLLSSNLFPQSPTVQQIIDSVNLDSLVYFVRELSGDVPTMINGTLQTILSRHKDQPGNELAENYIKQKLESYSLSTIIQSFSTSGKNILATQTGTEFQNRKYIICAHYDDMPPGSIAPGADDNASGTAAVIEAARILSQYSFPYTIVYALWDEEEQGLVGSEYYATQAANAGDSILGVINMDMIAYDSNSDGVCNVTNRASGLSKPLYNNMVDLNKRYGINLNIIPIMGYGSDHVSFWYSGYDAMDLMEDAFNDFNTHYHSTSDILQYFNQPYFLKMSKLALGTLAVFALDLNLDLFHTQITLNAPGEETNISLLISNGPPIGNGSLAPRMYFRTKDPGGYFGNFTEVVGTSTDGITYSFTIPALQNGTLVQYYLAAQDDNSTTVTTLPVGGWGYNPPGNIPPETFIQFLVADLTTVMLDEANSMADWTSDGGWGITTTEFVSPPSSFTDSPNGNYPPTSITSLQYNKQINVLNTISTFVEFDAKWDIELMNDCGMVQISTDNGSSWSSVAGQYTTPDVRYSFGDVNVYDGVQTDWVHEIMDISDFVNDQFSLRFMLLSNASLNMDGWYIDNLKVSVYATILAEQPTLDKSYAEKNMDSVLFRIKFTNIYDHQFTSNLIFANSDNSLIDSLTLFDDGLHGDSLANDGLYGVYIPPRQTEDFFYLSVSTLDHQINNYIRTPIIGSFTSVPLIIDSIQYNALTNYRYSFKPFLKNIGTIHTIEDVTVKLTSSDPWVTTIFPDQRTCPNIAPGETKSVYQAFAVTYDSTTFPGYFNLKFEILSNGLTYWYDSKKVVVIVEDEIILSSFDLDSEGWSVNGGNIYYQNSNGNPGGFIEFDDNQDGAGIFIAPSKFLGDLTLYDQGKLKFDLKNTYDNGQDSLYGYGNVRISSSNSYADKNVVPLGYISEWTSFSIPMTAGDWGLTESGWDSLLADVIEISIQMDAQWNYYDRVGLDNFSINPNPTDLESALFDAIASSYKLNQNYPNPFNPSTKIGYSITQSGLVTIKVYDVLGTEIETLVNEEKPVGNYELNWNAANLPSGVYFYRLQAGSFMQTRKMILLK